MGQGGEEECPELRLLQGEKWRDCSTQSAQHVMSVAWASQEDFLEKVVCDKAWKSRAAEGRCPRWEELRRVLGVPWGEAGSGHREPVFCHS